MAETTTDLEARLLDHVTRGEWLDLAGDEMLDPELMRSWGSERVIDARVIRDILLGRLAPDADPHGLRLRGARVEGPLDLENIVTDVHLELVDCHLTEGVVARDAHLASLILTGSVVEHPKTPPVSADRIATSAVDLAGCTVVGHTEAAAVALAGAKISGVLDFRSATVTNDAGPAIDADGVNIDHSVRLDFLVASGSGPDGTVLMTGARVSGVINAHGASLSGDSGSALLADRMEVDQGLVLRRLRATSASERATVRLLGAHVKGEVDAAGAVLRNRRPVAPDGTVKPSGPALDAEALQVGQDLFLFNRFRASSHSQAATVALIGSRIDGQLNLSRAVVRNRTGPAVDASGARIGQTAYLSERFTARGGGGLGAVRLQGTHIGGGLQLTTARLVNRSGPALAAAQLQVTQAFEAWEGVANGAGDDGAVVLRGAHVGGSLDARGAWVGNGSGPALDADGIRVDQDLSLAEGFRASGEGVLGVVRLSAAAVGGRLHLDPSAVTNISVSSARWELDGLRYSGLPYGYRVDDWLRMLREATPEYAAQPYRQFAAAAAAAGHDGDARRILIAQRRDQLDSRQLTAQPERFFAQLTGWTLGFGYQPWRALLLLLATAALSIMLTLFVGAAGGLRHTERAITPGGECSVVERIGVGLDLSLPLVKTGAQGQCAPTTTRTGSTITVLGWLLQLLAWAFATLFVAGFTGAVRKT